MRRSIVATWSQSIYDAEVEQRKRAMDLKSVYCGLYDRIERIERVYDNELARRRLK